MNRKSFFKSLLTLGAVALVSPLKLFEKKEVSKTIYEGVKLKGEWIEVNLKRGHDFNFDAIEIPEWVKTVHIARTQNVLINRSNEFYTL